MTHRVRVATVFAATLLHGACSAEQRATDASPAAKGAATAAVEDQTPAVRRGAEKKPAMTQARILISSERGHVTAELADNAAAQALLRMLPLTIEMRDHLRQEKTGNLPSPLPGKQRQTEFSAGTLGLWGSDDFVIYYRNGRVPAPGIVILGRVTGDVSIFDSEGPVTVEIRRPD
jgi:hypothetical protein